MKKIKSRFFKFFANQYMIEFINYVNIQKFSELTEIIYFRKIQNYFLVYAKIKQHYDWKFVDKSILELFHDHSDTNLNELFSLYTQNRETFNILTKDIDPITKFVILQPFKIVFKKFIENEQLLSNFLDKIKEDITKRRYKEKSPITKFTDTYYNVFKKTLYKFIDYYTE